MKPDNRPSDFLRLSVAVNRLTEGMWGGMRRAVPLTETKRDQKKLSLEFSLWRERAGQALRFAIEQGELAVYVLPDRPAPNDDHPDRNRSLSSEACRMPSTILKRLIGPRGIPPDHPIRPTFKTVGGDAALLARLAFGVLAIRKADFNIWYKSEKAKGTWPSQRSRLRKRIGRPSTQSDAIWNAILGLVNEGKWNAKLSISRLHRLLRESGRDNVPSPDTVARVVDQMYRERGDAELRRKKPRARSASKQQVNKSAP